MFGGGQQRQPEVATLLIQANVLLTTAQLHRTLAERREEQEEGLRIEGRSDEELREEAESKTEGRRHESIRDGGGKKKEKYNKHFKEM